MLKKLVRSTSVKGMHITNSHLTGICRNCVVLCHHSPRQIFLTVGQDSLYSRCRPLSIYVAPPSVNSGILHFGPRHSFHPPTSGRICFRLSRATQGVTSSAHPHRPSSIKLVHQKGWPDPAVPFI